MILSLVAMFAASLLLATALPRMAMAPPPERALAAPGLETMLSIDQLPFLKDQVSVRYEGSIDKTGGNADWDWWLFPDRDEWVIFDVDGPGCIYNFAQHRYPSSAEPTFRFYFDGATTPRFTIRQSEFGKKYPFVEPLAGIFAGDDPTPTGRGPIWVIRSFVPLPFARSCRVTSSVKLEGFDRALGHGGWGHVVYHVYPTAAGVRTFTGTEDYAPLIVMWKNVGVNPRPAAEQDEVVSGTVDLPPGASAVLLDRAGEAAVGSIKLKIEPFRPALLHHLWIRITWDGEARPAVECPLGTFFGNEFGHHDQRYLTHGMTVSGDFYNYFPMPFWKSARVELSNRARRPVTGVRYEIGVTPPSVIRYPKARCGYFRASPYYPRTDVTPGRDSTIARIAGRGHVVAGHVCGWPVGGRVVSCEGDLRVYVDGSGTPCVESDGSESWGCYGWGFPSPPQSNPTSGYDGSGPELFTWSEVRVCTGDFYPFRTGLTFNMEAGGQNDWPMAHSGIVFYYGVGAPGWVLTDSVDVGDAESERTHEYRVQGPAEAVELSGSYEGSEDATVISDRGRTIRGASEFVVTVLPGNVGVVLRRRCDQSQGRLRARVFVDGTLVSERTWYFADRNPHKRWLDDEFEIPARYTRGKRALRIRIEPTNAAGEGRWNEFRYWVFSRLDGE